MIRYPERFHASDTPGAHHYGGIEPNYLEERRAHASPQVHHVGGARVARPMFDFTALAAVLR